MLLDVYTIQSELGTVNLQSCDSPFPLLRSPQLRHTSIIVSSVTQGGTNEATEHCLWPSGGKWRIASFPRATSSARPSQRVDSDCSSSSDFQLLVRPHRSTLPLLPWSHPQRRSLAVNYVPTGHTITAAVDYVHTGCLFHHRRGFIHDADRCPSDYVPTDHVFTVASIEQQKTFLQHNK